MKHVKTFFVLLLLACAMPFALGDEAIQNETELVTFVQSAAAHAHDVGKTQAVNDFMDLKGPWVRGETYIFAHDFNGTTLSLPYNSSAVGTNRQGVQDLEGKYINQEMQAIAMNGSGFYSYLYQNPITNQTQLKVSYVMKVDDTWWLGSGIFLPEENKTLTK